MLKLEICLLIIRLRQWRNYLKRFGSKQGQWNEYWNINMVRFPFSALYRLSEREGERESNGGVVRNTLDIYVGEYSVVAQRPTLPIQLRNYGGRNRLIVGWVILDNCIETKTRLQACLHLSSHQQSPQMAAGADLAGSMEGISGRVLLVFGGVKS